MYTTRKELTREKQKSVFSQNDSQSTEVLFGDMLLALANEVKKKENETKTLHSQYARKITELTNENDMIKSENRKLQSEKLATDRANSENFFKYHQVKNENEVLKRKNDELTSERDSLLSIKSEYDQMTKMFGDFSVQFMETQGTISDLNFWIENRPDANKNSIFFGQNFTSSWHLILTDQLRIYFSILYINHCIFIQ